MKDQAKIGLAVAKSDVLRSEVKLANAQQNLLKAQALSLSKYVGNIGLPRCL